ncbi:MAG: sugar phosphate isomerase/epimerase [Oscillospiraceae bacterium]|jgi:sugar phosphate isomerase/epimerase|nr:sugar phosphate isomerase/epimerase [Oscillospiraceae bacterium]
MTIDTSKLHISTVADDAEVTARAFGLGLEIAEFCTAMNMDAPNFAQWDAKVRAETDGITQLTFHAPFNELCPAAIEPRVLDVARARYREAAALAASYGARRIVVHSGYVPHVYFKGYFAERSVEFWTELLRDTPDEMEFMLENVLEDEPELLAGIVRNVNSPRFKLCLDIGHASCIVSDVPLATWIATDAPHIGHLHIHNNYREWDHHNALGDGLIDMDAALTQILTLAPDATYTIESIDAGSSARWLRDNGYIPAPSF